MNKTALIFIGLGVLVLSLLFVWLRPQADAGPTATSALPASAAQAQVFAYRVKQGQRVAGSAVIRIRKGQSLTLEVTSDTADELHLHGYDLHAQVRAGKTATLTFTAVHAGQFPLELHHSNIELATLQVRPQ